eukprot:TRINITY_DN858_c0_g1_i1.p1 TRINITY_DN858_c0_g1~~TRINITY_DN858_c0_g1_i1.p1  ORF type:complete len:136 (-),score=36.78 TRINITY_DN858_c0_g1_i1:88-495(-)
MKIVSKVTTPIVNIAKSTGSKLGGWAESKGAQLLAKEETSCVCNNTFYKFVGTKLKCIPNKWSTAPAEATEWLTKVVKGEVTMGQLGKGGIYGFQFAVLFFVGESIGRGSFYGYPVGRKNWITNVDSGRGMLSKK